MVEARSAMMPQTAVMGALTFAPRPMKPRIFCQAPGPNDITRCEETFIACPYRRLARERQESARDSRPSKVALRTRRHAQRRHDLLDLRALTLEPRRQDQRLAEMCRIFIDREARSIRGQFEQNTARFLEVDRLEPEAVDHRRRMRAARGDTRS